MGRLGLLTQFLLAGAGVGFACARISEIAAAPRDGEPEWIELQEVRGVDRDAAGWSLEDGSARRSVASPTVLPANGFLVVASDCAKLRARYGSSSIPCVQTEGWNALSKEDERLVLRDARGGLCDSVAWSRSTWGEWPTGRSLERLDPDGSGSDIRNWVASSHPLGGTPGWKGGTALQPVGGETGLEIVSRKVRPGREPARLRIRAPWNLRVKIEVFDLTRRRKAVVLDGQIPANGMVEWDGVGGGRLVPPGVYGVVVEFTPTVGLVGKSLFRDWLVVEK